jgi:peptidylglycine monooxygenase
LYLCSPVKIDNNNTYYIIGFEPNATMNTAHHIILYSCSKPGSTESVWNCGEMLFNENSLLTVASPCRDNSEVYIINIIVNKILITAI